MKPLNDEQKIRSFLSNVQSVSHSNCLCPNCAYVGRVECLKQEQDYVTRSIVGTIKALFYVLVGLPMLSIVLMLVQPDMQKHFPVWFTPEPENKIVVAIVFVAFFIGMIIRSIWGVYLEAEGCRRCPYCNYRAKPIEFKDDYSIKGIFKKIVDKFNKE